MIKLFKLKKASVALTSVLLISAILLSSGITLVLTNIDLARASKDFFALQKNKLNAETCLEESLFDIKQNFSYTGTFNYSNPVGSCTAVVSDGTPSTIKIVEMTSIVGDYYYRTTVRIDTTQNPIAVVK
jgi:hypothetical protein